MPVLLGVLPYVAGVLAYWTVYRGLFREYLDKPPWGWPWRLVQPLFISSLTPLLLAATPNASDKIPELLTLSGSSLMAGVILMSVLMAAESGEQDEGEVRPRGRFFFSLRNFIPFGRWYVHGLTWARLIFLLGITVIAVNAGFALWVAQT